VQRADYHPGGTHPSSYRDATTALYGYHDGDALRYRDVGFSDCYPNAIRHCDAGFTDRDSDGDHYAEPTDRYRDDDTHAVPYSDAAA
jgi:hypothetical protein